MVFNKLDKRDLTALIRQRRRELGLTQRQLGDLLGIDQRTISSLEKTPNSISVHRFFAVLEALLIELFTQPPSEQERTAKVLTIEQVFKNSGIL